MAKAAWLTVNPTSGNGNATVQNTGTVHTGREQRETTVTGVAVGVSPNKTYKVIQKGKTEFASFNDGAETTVSKTGGTLTITGKTNSSKLNFELVDLKTRAVVEGGLELTLPSKYTAVDRKPLTMWLSLVTLEHSRSSSLVSLSQVLHPIRQLTN